MLRQAIASAAPTDAALLNLCCASQRSSACQQSDLVLLAEKALEGQELIKGTLRAIEPVIKGIEAAAQTSRQAGV
ncbi:hypothetical protein ABBQ38_008301 [Trebouxia sp. C0009 RCD-2024]